MKDMNKKTYLQPPTTISSKQSHLDRLAFLQKQNKFSVCGAGAGAEIYCVFVKMLACPSATAYLRWWLVVVGRL